MRFRAATSGSEEPRIEIAPLIDVVFLLLLFFLLTTSFVRHHSIDVVLPESGGEEVAHEIEELSVVISADGRYAFGGEIMDGPKIANALQREARLDPGRTLLLIADRDVSHGRVVAVMDMAREAGLQRISIVTRSTGSPEH